jgi:hypothetical protein
MRASQLGVTLPFSAKRPCSLSEDRTHAPAAQGVSKFGRYRIVPESGPAYVSDDEAAKRPPTALADNLRASLEKGPVKFRLLVQVGAADDPTSDRYELLRRASASSRYWLRARQVPRKGRLELNWSIK